MTLPAFIQPFILIPILLVWFGTHTIQQGNVGVYMRGGRVVKAITEPGYNLKVPFITWHHNVQVAVQTDRLENIPCVSSQGGTAYLNIEVVNRLRNSQQCVLKAVSEFTLSYDEPLIFDFVPSEVAQFCKDHTLESIYIREFDTLDERLADKLRTNIKTFGMDSCLEILKVRISRRLSDELAKRFEAIEHEVKERQLQVKLMETEKVKLQAELQKAQMQKKKEQEEMIIEMETKVEKEKRVAEIASVAAQSKFNTAKLEADAIAYAASRESEGIVSKITAFRTNSSSGNKEYLELQRINAYWKSENKVYLFGDSSNHLPQTLFTKD